MKSGVTSVVIVVIISLLISFTYCHKSEQPPCDTPGVRCMIDPCFQNNCKYSDKCQANYCYGCDADCPCEHESDCHTGEYCSSYHICLSQSRCYVDKDCGYANNIFSKQCSNGGQPLLYCSSGQCEVNCGEPITCFSSSTCPDNYKCDTTSLTCVLHTHKCDPSDCKGDKPLCADGTAGNPVCVSVEEHTRDHHDCQWVNVCL